MAVNLTGFWSVEGLDLWDNFGAVIMKGTADFLKYAPAKPATQHDWDGESGVELDTSNPQFAPRTIVLQMGIHAANTLDCHTKRESLIAQLMTPGLHSFRIASHGLARFYAVSYRECSPFTAIKPLRLPSGDELSNVHHFTLTLFEPKPTLQNASSFITDEAGRFIVS